LANAQVFRTAQGNSSCSESTIAVHEVRKAKIQRFRVYSSEHHCKIRRVVEHSEKMSEEICFFAHLIVLWLTPKIGGTSTIKIKPFLFCIVFGLHYLFIS